MGEREYAELTRLISQMIQENAGFHEQRKQELAEFRQEVNERFDKVEKRLANLEDRVTNIEYQLKIINREHLQVKADVERLEDKVYKLESEAA
jgi:chromosome segregation ATPase